MALDIKSFVNGLMGENTYLITDIDSNEQVIIDPGYYGQDIADSINVDSLKYIILTHGHFDHYNNAVDVMKQCPSVKLVGPDKERYLLSQGINTEFSRSGIKHNACPPIDQFVTEKDTLHIGNTEISFIETPGHTEGSMCVQIDDVLFSGDTLFRLSVGNTSFETGSFSELVESINNKLFILDDDTVVYPGHGLKTTIGYEKRANPFV